MSSYPVLYSYRRCPYAMRARMGIYLAGIQVEQREIVFWDKPQEMLLASPKGTVPVLLTNSGQVIDESRDILNWALSTAGLEQRYCPAEYVGEINQWIDRNDNEFKHWLDRFKYADRYPEESITYYRQAGEAFLSLLEQALHGQFYLVNDDLTAADIAVFPFVRQFINVDKVWWESAGYPNIKSWFSNIVSSEFFMQIMKNRPVWEPVHKPLWVIEEELDTKDQFRHKALN